MRRIFKENDNTFSLTIINNYKYNNLDITFFNIQEILFLVNGILIKYLLNLDNIGDNRGFNIYIYIYIKKTAGFSNNL